MTTTTSKPRSIHLPKTASPAAAAFLSGARAIVPVLLALLPFGLAFGATAAGSGLSALEALGMSVFVAAGAAQLAAVQLISAGASAAVVILTVLVINLRFMLYGASLAPHFRKLPLGWKGLLSYHLTDQAFAATMAGVFLGAWVSEDLSLDFVLPLVFIALALPAIKDRTTGAAALSAGVAALFAAALPLNLGLIGAALVGILGGLAMETLTGRSKR